MMYNTSHMNHEREIENLQALSFIRRKLGIPLVTDMNVAVAVVVNPISMRLNSIADDGEEVYKLIPQSEKFLEKNGLPTTPAMVAAQYVGFMDTLVESMPKKIIEREEDDPKLKAQAALMFDIAKGMQMISGAVYAAHISEIPQSTIDPMLKVIELLKQDPSGFSVIDWQINRLKTQGSPQIKSYEIPKAVIAGAELGRDLYRKIYPKVVSLNASHN